MMQDNPTHNLPPRTNVPEVGVYGVSNTTMNNILTARRITCRISETVSGGWNAPPETCEEDSNGKVVCTQPPTYDAHNLKSKSKFTKWTNNLTNEIVAQYYGRGITSDNVNKTVTNFKDMGLGGFNINSKLYSAFQHKILASDTIRKTLIALKEDPFNDSDYTDIQRGWECGGKFVEMDNTTDYSASCRPVNILEAVYYSCKNNITVFYKTDLTPDPVCPKEIDLYPKKYAETHGVQLKLNLALETYQNILDKYIITALGPGLTKIVDNNFDNICSPWPSFVPCEKNPKKYDFVTSNSLTGDPMLAQISSYTHQNIPFNPIGAVGVEPSTTTANQYGVEPFAQPFSCKDVIINDENPFTVPNPLEGIIAYINGLVRPDINSASEPNWSYSDNIVREFMIPPKTAITAFEDTNNLANLLPAGYPQAKKQYDEIQQAQASSKECKNCPPQSGYQLANKLLPSIRCYLHPASWQKQYNEDCPDNSSPSTL